MSRFEAFSNHFKGHWNFSVVDQAVYSATSVVSTILTARLLGVDLFGVWALILLLSLLHSDINRALITQPMMRYAAIRPLRHYFGVAGLIIAAIVLIGAVVIAFLTALVIKLSNVSFESFWSLIGLLFIVAVSRSIFDITRGIFQAYERGQSLLLVDIVHAMALLAPLIILLVTPIDNQGNYSLILVMLIYTVASAIAVAAAYGGINTIFRSDHHRPLNVRKLIKSHIDFGGWLALANTVKWFGSNLILLTSAVFLSTADTGLLRATISIFGPIGIAYQLADNLLFVRLSKLELREQVDAANNLFIDGTVLLAIIAALGIAALCLSEQYWLIPLFGSGFEGVAQLVPIMGLVYFSLSLVNMAQLKLRLLHKTRALFNINVVLALITLVLCPFYFHYLGIYAFAVAVLINNTLILILVQWILRRSHCEESMPHYSSL